MKKITLKSIKLHEGLSQETPCYTATVCLNGKKIAYTENNGYGGSDNIHFVSKEAEKSYFDYAKECGIDVENSYSPYGELEVHCHDLVWKDLDAKKLKRMLKNKILIQGDKKGEWETFAFNRNFIKEHGMDKIVSVYFQKLIDGDISGIPSDRKMLNRMPFDKALECYTTL